MIVLEQKSYAVCYLPNEGSIESVLRFRPKAKLYNNGKPLIICLADSGDPLEDKKTEPTALEARQLHALGLHLIEQMMAGKGDTISAIWRAGKSIDTEFIVPPIIVVQRTPAGSWMAGILGRPTADGREYTALKCIRGPNSYQAFPSLYDVAFAVCKILRIGEMRKDIAEIKVATTLPRFPSEEARRQRFHDVAKTFAAKTFRTSDWHEGTNWQTFPKTASKSKRKAQEIPCLN